MSCPTAGMRADPRVARALGWNLRGDGFARIFVAHRRPNWYQTGHETTLHAAIPDPPPASTPQSGLVQHGGAQNLCPAAISIRHDHSTLNPESKPRPRAGVRGLRRFSRKMTTIKTENGWFNQIDLLDGEEVVLSYPSNHSQGKRAVGGKLFLTNQRVAFAPNRFDANQGGLAFDIPLSRITSIATDSPRIRLSEIYSGALRTRLAIHGGIDQVNFFVVSHPDIVVSQITMALKRIAEQTSTGQPTACPVDEPEGSDKPQPEAERRRP